jgi:hypothetical protein
MKTERVKRLGRATRLVHKDDLKSKLSMKLSIRTRAAAVVARI